MAAQPFLDRIRDFSRGVVTAWFGDSPESPSPRGRNSRLTEGLQPATRLGTANVMNGNDQAGATPMHAQHLYKHVSGGTTTRYHIWATASGILGHVNSDPGSSGSFSNLTTGLGSGVPSLVSAHNHLFYVNGTSLKKVRGTTVETFGIATPTGAPTLATGAAGTPSGTYECRYTYYNGNTGHESSASPTSTAVAFTSQIISISGVTASADSQVTARRVYLRNTATMANFYLAATINDNSTTTTSFNAADSTLITKGPDTDENDPPPSDLNVLAMHRGRMFGSNGTHLYYAKLGSPESWDPTFFEYVAPQDGQVIRALLSLDDILLIFKDRSIYGLFGVDPETWQIRLLIPDLGTLSHRSLRVVDGVLYFWTHKGPARWRPGSDPDLIGERLLGEATLGPAVLAHGEFNDVVAEAVPSEALLLWSVADFGQTRNTRILPFNTKLGCFVSDAWDPIDVASMCLVEDDVGRLFTYFGTYSGQIHRYGNGVTNDSLTGGTGSGTFVQSGTTLSTITGSGFYTTGRGLEERYVTLQDSNGDLVARRRISSNTSTVLTLASSITGLTNGATYTYYVGAPNFEWDTPTSESGSPFLKKRFTFGFFQAQAATSTTLRVSWYTKTQTSPVKRHSVSLTSPSPTQDQVTHRLHLGFVGNAWSARFACRTPDTPVTLEEFGVKGEVLTDKLS